MSIAEVLPEPWIPKNESHREWAVLSVQAPQMSATMRRYLVQLTTFLAPRSVDVADSTLRQLARWLVAETDVVTVAGITRTHIEDYKVWLAAQPGMRGGTMAKNTQRQRLRMIRIFLERLIEWDWPEAHRRNDPSWGHPAPPRATAQVPLRRGLGQAPGCSQGPSPAPLSAGGRDAVPHRHAGDRALRAGGGRRVCAGRVPLAAHPRRQAAQRPDDPAPSRARPAAG